MLPCFTICLVWRVIAYLRSMIELGMMKEINPGEGMHYED